MSEENLPSYFSKPVKWFANLYFPKLVKGTNSLKINIAGTILHIASKFSDQSHGYPQLYQHSYLKFRTVPTVDAECGFKTSLLIYDEKHPKQTSFSPTLD